MSIRQDRRRYKIFDILTEFRYNIKSEKNFSIKSEGFPQKQYTCIREISIREYSGEKTWQSETAEICGCIAGV